MKRFIVSTLVVSLAFIGAGAVADKIIAGYKSDDKALAIIAKARAAIGGDAKAAAVRSFITKGQTSKTVSVNGMDRFEQGETEIVFESPNRLMKMVKIGDPNAAGGDLVEKRVDVVVVGKPGDGPQKVRVNAGDGEFTTEDGKKIIIQKTEDVEWTGQDGEGKVFVRKSADGGEWTGKDGEAKVFVRKSTDGGEWVGKDGDVREITTPDGKTVTVVTRGAGDGNATFTTKDGNKMMLHDKMAGPHGGDNELLRTTLSLLLTAPEGIDVAYTYAGETNLEGTLADTVVATSGGTSFKLFFDRSTSLPLGLSYVGHGPVMIKMRTSDGSAPAEKDVVTFNRKIEGPGAGAETVVRFSDFRNVDGLLLPYKWTTTVGGKSGEVFDVSSYELNPANISERFKGENVRIEMKKPGGK